MLDWSPDVDNPYATAEVIFAFHVGYIADFLNDAGFGIVHMHLPRKRIVAHALDTNALVAFLSYACIVEDNLITSINLTLE